MMHVAILLFALCAAGDPDDCEMGEIRARSCAAAEAYLRAGMRPGQTLFVWGCEAMVAGR